MSHPRGGGITIAEIVVIIICLALVIVGLMNPPRGAVAEFSTPTEVSA